MKIFKTTCILRYCQGKKHCQARSKLGNLIVVLLIIRTGVIKKIYRSITVILACAADTSCLRVNYNKSSLCGRYRPIHCVFKTRLALNKTSSTFQRRYAKVRGVSAQVIYSNSYKVRVRNKNKICKNS